MEGPFPYPYLLLSFAVYLIIRPPPPPLGPYNEGRKTFAGTKRHTFHSKSLIKHEGNREKDKQRGIFVDICFVPSSKLFHMSTSQLQDRLTIHLLQPFIHFQTHTFTHILSFHVHSSCKIMCKRVLLTLSSSR